VSPVEWEAQISLVLKAVESLSSEKLCHIRERNLLRSVDLIFDLALLSFLLVKNIFYAYYCALTCNLLEVGHERD
jgi:uncharacterized membrane protein